MGCESKDSVIRMVCVFEEVMCVRVEVNIWRNEFVVVVIWGMESDKYSSVVFGCVGCDNGIVWIEFRCDFIVFECSVKVLRLVLIIYLFLWSID